MQSMSLSGLMKAATFSASICLGSGLNTSMPCTLSSLFSLSIRARSSSVVDSLAMLNTSESIFKFALTFSIAFSYDMSLGSSPSLTIAIFGAMPFARKSSIFLLISALIISATGLPFKISVIITSL